MSVKENDFILEPAAKNSDLFNLTFMKRVKKRETGKYEIEPGDPLYGLTLTSALRKIALHRTAKKYEDANLSLKEFLAEYRNSLNEIKNLLYEN